MMKKKIINKINNSYESEEPSSNSVSPPSQNQSFEEDGGHNFQNLPQMLNPKNIYNNSNNNNKRNEVNCDGSKIKINRNKILIKDKNVTDDATVYSSQESDFAGFTNTQINKTNNNKQHNLSLYINDDQQNELENSTISSRYDDDDTSITENDDSYLVEKDENVTNHLAVDETTTSSLKFKICSKIIPETGETVYEMLSIENSCNAVDTNLSPLEKIEEESSEILPVKELSFNGKIKSMTVDSITNHTMSSKVEINTKLINGKETNTDNSSTVISDTEVKSKLRSPVNDQKIFVSLPSNETLNIAVASDEEKLNEIGNKKANNAEEEEEVKKTIRSPCESSIPSTSTSLQVQVSVKDNQTCDNEKTKISILKNELDLTNNFYQKYTNERSPDLFADDDDYDDNNEGRTNINENTDVAAQNLHSIENEINVNETSSSTLNVIIERDNVILKRIQHSLSGVPPPPSLTTLQLDIPHTIYLKRNNIYEFMEDIKNLQSTNNDGKENLFKPSHNSKDIENIEWPNFLNLKCHGLCYNVSTATEKFEQLSLSVVDRYIGAECKTSFQLSPSSAKKRNMRLKQLTQSPGSRLSHLAKRRAIFSSANLQSNSQKVSSLANNTNVRQILLNTKSTNRRKIKIATPKRVIQGNRRLHGRKTPSSSAKKRLQFHPIDKSKPVPTRETSKRALFQSPPQQIVAPPINKPLIKPEIANRVEKSKRALFSPDKSDLKFSQPNLYKSSSSYQLNDQTNTNNKRKRLSEDGPNLLHNSNSNKIFRPNSETTLEEKLTPRTLKFKSQSFNGVRTSGKRNSIENISTLNNGKPILRTCSDTSFGSSQLTESHTKKLLWAVSTALQEKQISLTNNSDFKKYASVLAKAVRRLFVEYFRKSGTSTSDTMLRLSKKYVYRVLQGSSADEIYLTEKHNIERNKMGAPLKLSGYIAPQDYANIKNNAHHLRKTNSCTTILSGISSSMESLQHFNSQTRLCSQSSELFDINHKYSQDNLLLSMSSSSSLSVNNLLTTNTESTCSLNNATNSNQLPPIQPNKSLQNSSSKNNLNGLALRENVDCEQRKSAQKNFTGKDQRNVSPYLDKVRASSTTSTLKSKSLLDLNAFKAKRQLFDC